jgi:hypothetical protein
MGPPDRTVRPHVDHVTDVPWNRPWYEHLGFVVLDDTQIGPQLRSVREAETRHGLDPAKRVCMRLNLEE